ncbi:hypothetical protein Tco_0024094 [Tanacetum coccineum]|uniref:Uncharacterized protein n=1 Tax=Tanacetum coccineum TaxID=301880 RepID=A0ABQ5ARR9_9ASTR
MPTEMELTLEQTQQGVSYEVSVFTMKMEILLEPTSNKLMVEHAEYDESNASVLERFNTTAGNPVKKILRKLNLSDHRLFKDGGGDAQDHNVKLQVQGNRLNPEINDHLQNIHGYESVKKDEAKDSRQKTLYARLKSFVKWL